MNDDKRVRIFNSRTGESRLSEPVRQHAPKRAEADAPSTPPIGERPLESVAQPTTPTELGSVPVSTDTTAEPTDAGSGAKVQGKAKPEIATLEQFIAHAYGMKGRKVALKSKVERTIAEEARLGDDAQARLMVLAREDRLFAVPRQLLLVTREVNGYPALRATLRAFVRDVMLDHALFKRIELGAAIRNLPEAPPVAQALAMVLEEPQRPPADGEEQVLKPGEFDELRTNAAYCLAAWLVDTRNLSLSDVTEALNTTLWAPRARRVDHDNGRLRALTEIEQVAGVGLACQQYRQQAIEKTALADQTARDAAAAKERATSLEVEVGEACDSLARTELELQRVRRESEATLNALRTASENELAHLRDDVEQMRTRMLRRLAADIEQLDVGLSALRGPEPRVHVIQDRVERVVDSLRAEVNKLKEG